MYAQQIEDQVDSDTEEEVTPNDKQEKKFGLFADRPRTSVEKGFSIFERLIENYLGSRIWNGARQVYES